ncbi:MAG: penicillin-binding protein 1C [Magnetococcales bacterium]|nr:penicillin-binding protein 1C [Magnetococcales bacterium]
MLVALVLGVAGLWLLDRLFPPDLSRYLDRSRLVTDARGELLRPFLSRDHKWRLHTRPDDVDPGYLAMLLAYEDGRYARHVGIDPLALMRAAWQWIQAGRPVSGGSTLTMQVARLLEPRSRTLGAKLVELWRALQLEWRFDKQEILSIYLTLAPMGGNLEGVRAASLAYWGREPHQLTLGQAALLTALPQSPAARRPDRHPQAAALGVARVLERMVRKGVISLARSAEAAQEPIPRTRIPLPFVAPHLSWRLIRQEPPGAVVRTTVHAPLQRALEALVRRQVDRFDDGATAAFLVVENSGRAVRAYLSGHSFQARAGQVDLVRALRSPGSALKPFLYGLAMDDLAIHPETILEDRPLRYGGYVPRNFDTGHAGAVTARQALRDSLNLPAIALADRVGPLRFAGLLTRGGARLVFPKSDLSPGLAVALGGVGITLEDLATLYVALANGGEAGRLRMRLDEPVASAPQPFLSAGSSWHLTRILAGAARPDLFSQQSGGTGRGVIAYKTGTSYGYRDAWAFGYSDQYTVGVWVGRADGSARPGHYGRNTAAPLLFQIFDLLPESADPRLRPPPDGILLADTNDQLPEGLRRFRPADSTLAAVMPVRGDPPRILFPPDGSGLELSPGEAVTLLAEGGSPPLSWLVNGMPLAQPRWFPDGMGFNRLVVVDRLGRQDVAVVRVRQDLVVGSPE